MTNLKKLSRFLRSRSGATAIEYALIATMICLAIIAGVTSVGGATSGAFTDVSEGVWGAAAP